MEYVLTAFAVGLIGALILGAARIVRQQPWSGWGRILLVLFLLAPLPFSVFGFAATFEPGEYHWIWRIAYAGVFIGCLGGIIRACWPRQSKRIQRAVSEDRISPMITFRGRD